MTKLTKQERLVDALTMGAATSGPLMYRPSETPPPDLRVGRQRI